jgi:hypothetical protein
MNLYVYIYCIYILYIYNMCIIHMYIYILEEYDEEIIIIEGQLLIYVCIHMYLYVYIYCIYITCV